MAIAMMRAPVVLRNRSTATIRVDLSEHYGCQRLNSTSGSEVDVEFGEPYAKFGASSPCSSIPVSGNENDNRGQQHHQEEHDRRHDESPGAWRDRQLSVPGYGADQQHDEHHGDSHREPHARRPGHRLMTVSVVDIWVMRMAVEQALVNVSV